MDGKTNQRRKGSEYEALAADYLQGIGYRIVERNFRCRSGEIDLIARDGEVLVFVEVKYRGSRRSGDPLEAVTERKQQTISRVAQYYMLRNGISFDTPCRGDVGGITGQHLEHVKDAFLCR